MSIRCGHCKGHHTSIREVRECAGAAAPRTDSPSDAANRMAASLTRAVKPSGWTLAAEGMYRLDGQLYAVKDWAGHRYARSIDLESGVYSATDRATYIEISKRGYRLTLAEAIEVSRQLQRCCLCGRPLELATSIAQGMGDKCRDKVGG